jgi:hypothetical protein
MCHTLYANKLSTNVYSNSDPEYPVDLNTLISYADRVRMRPPGDKQFNLGPHSDSGSIELWEYVNCIWTLVDHELILLFVGMLAIDGATTLFSKAYVVSFD